jgi:hypothetical protein
MQMVISDLDRLANGGMPTITVTGPIAEIVQFMQTPGNVSMAGNIRVPAILGSLPAGQSSAGGSAGAASIAPHSAGPIVASSGNSGNSGNSGSVSAAGAQSGSMAQMGSAISNAVTAATGATSQPSASTSGVAAASAVSNTHLQASTTAPASQPVMSDGPTTATRTIPVGTSGQVVVLSALPNAAALTTAVQNDVHAATIQTQTTISATLNSLPSFNAISLGNSIRAQMAGGG